MIAHRVLLAAGILAAVMLGSLPASAADWKPFTQAEFSAAQKDGKPILLDIFAAWCPTCRAQKPILEELTAKPPSSKHSERRRALRHFGISNGAP